MKEKSRGRDCESKQGWEYTERKVRLRKKDETMKQKTEDTESQEE